MSDEDDLKRAKNVLDLRGDVLPDRDALKDLGTNLLEEWEESKESVERRRQKKWNRVVREWTAREAKDRAQPHITNELLHDGLAQISEKLGKIEQAVAPTWKTNSMPWVGIFTLVATIVGILVAIFLAWKAPFG